MNKEIRLNLRELRQAHDLSQEELAEALGISRQSIISLERGEYLPSFNLFLEIIRYFGCPLEELVPQAKDITEQEDNINKKGGEKEDMSLTLWNPFQAIDQIHDEMSDAVERTFKRADWSRLLGGAIGAMNIHEDDKEYEIHIQAPGFEENEVNVEISEDNVLTISGSHKQEAKEEDKKSLVRREWEQTEFSRSIRFAQPIAANKVEAKLKNGNLIVIAPKIQPTKPKTTKIAVKKS